MQFSSRGLAFFGLAVLLVAGGFLGSAPPAARGAEQPEPAFRYPEGTFGPAELRYRQGLPVLQVQGTPEEIGEQAAVLAMKPAEKFLNYPRDCVRILQLDFAWGTIVSVGKTMLKNFPADHLAELEAMADKHPGSRDLLVAGNTMFDIKKFFGCSTLHVDAAHSTTGGPLLGRNLDFPTLGYLQDYTLVTVYRPEGKRPFASIGFPGMVGVLSGINDAGLSVAVLEVYRSADNSTRFDVQGTPYGLCYRRLLEECATVGEAVTLLRSMKRTTYTNLAVADKKQGAVLEITPERVVVRPQDASGILPCTNHFRTAGLTVNEGCRRYARLTQARQQGRLSVDQVFAKLGEVHQGSLTLQSMIFEPATLKLHLAIGDGPTTRQPLRTLDLAPLLRPAQPANAAIVADKPMDVAEPVAAGVAVPKN